MPRSFLSVTFLQASGETVVSRTFTTLQAARKWASWLLTQSYALEVSIYRGAPGATLIERRAA